MTKTATYLRFSSADKGDSIAAQRDLCAKWLTDHGVTEHVEFAEDRQSASKKAASARPEWARLVAEIRAGRVTRVVARHLDRLTRRTLDLEELVTLVEDTGVEFVTLWSGQLDLNTAAGRQTARILVSVAQGESENKSERIRAQKARAREQGRATGGPRPFGFEGHYGPLRESEAALIRQGIDMILAGDSMHAVQRMFQASDVPTPRGAPQWNKKTVRELILRWRNAGRVEHNGQDVGEGQFPAIVPLETVQAVRAVLLDPTRQRTDKEFLKGAKASTLLSGIATCGDCGGTLKGRTNVVQTQAGGVRTQVGRVGVYACSSCHLSIKRDVLDPEVSAAMLRFYSQTTPAELAPKADQKALSEAYATQQALEDERRGIVALMTSGDLTTGEARGILAGLRERAEEVEKTVERLLSDHAVAAAVAAPIVDGRADVDAHAALKQRWEAQPLDVRRKQVASVYKVIVRRRHHAKGLGLPADLKERARIEFENLISPTRSFTLLNEIMAELD